MLDNIYVIADGAERACVKINYLGYEISIAAEAIGSMSILTRTSVRVYRNGIDVTSEFNISCKDVTLDTIVSIQNQICGCGVYTPNYKYHFMKNSEVIVSELDFNIEWGNIWAINTLFTEPVDISKMSIESTDKANNKYTDSGGKEHYISDLFWGEKCVCLSAAKAQEVLKYLKECFATDKTWREIARKLRHRRDLELASRS